MKNIALLVAIGAFVIALYSVHLDHLTGSESYAGQAAFFGIIAVAGIMFFVGAQAKEDQEKDE